MGNKSILVMTVAPVVVSPEADSNMASVRLKLLSGSIKKGMEPKRANMIQNEATIIKPSFSLISGAVFLLGSQIIRPAKSVKVKEAKNEEAV